jgi:hypothetical protein
MSGLRFLTTNRPWRRPSRRVAIASIALVFVAGCTPSPPGALLTDPHDILVKAIRSTAALSTVRIHADMAVSMAGLGVGGGGDMRMSLDADVDLVHRQMAGRATTQTPNLGGLGVPGGQPAQVAEFITLSGASFSRTGGSGRWTKISTGAVGPVGPTNDQIAAMIENLLSNPSVKLDRADTASCSLGTCYHVIANLDGQAALQALAAAMGAPANTAGIAIPPLTFDLMVDQATGVLSEIRFQTKLQGTSVQMLAVFSNPNADVTIVAPPAAIVDDINLNPAFGGGGGVVTMTPEPSAPEPEPS